MFSVIFILDEAEFPETKRDIVISAIGKSGSWDSVAKRDNREMFDCVLESLDVLGGLGQLLADRNPVIVGTWNEDGSIIGAIDLKEYSDITGTTSEVHQFSGWAKREGFSIYG